MLPLPISKQSSEEIIFFLLPGERNNEVYNMVKPSAGQSPMIPTARPIPLD
jgi:hypothetical protein